MLWIFIVFIVVVIDRTSKLIVIKSIPMGKDIVIIDKFFYLVHGENKGAAWGIFQNGRIFFIILTIIVSVFIIYYLYKTENKILKLSLSFILGGALGNLIDRAFRGSVTDFLDFHFGSYNFPTFNVADMLVVCGTILLAICILKDEK
jgi:signal peptidase II